MQTTVTELFVHGPRSTQPQDVAPSPMVSVDKVEAVEGMGLREDSRYFRPAVDGTDRKRQVCLIDEATIERLERRFGPIPHDCIKAQIILSGEVFLPDMIENVLTFESGAALRIAKLRDPCYAMDLIVKGLKEAMANGQQGGLARVVTSGQIRVGDSITIQAPIAAAAI